MAAAAAIGAVVMLAVLGGSTGGTLDDFNDRCDVIGGRVEARWTGTAGGQPVYEYHCWLGDEDITDP